MPYQLRQTPLTICSPHHLLKHEQQRTRILLTEAAAPERIELQHHPRGNRKRQPGFVRKFERDADLLVVQRGNNTGRKIALDGVLQVGVLVDEATGKVLEEFMQGLRKRNPGEDEFQQAVQEFSEAMGDLYRTLPDPAGAFKN